MKGQLLRPQKAGAGQTWAWLGALLCLGAEEGWTDRGDGCSQQCVLGAAGARVLVPLWALLPVPPSLHLDS